MPTDTTMATMMNNAKQRQVGVDATQITKSSKVAMMH
jgi:hypothetical protein